MEAQLNTEGQTSLPRYFAQVFRIAQTLKNGRLDFVMPDGRRFRAEGKAPGPVAEIHVHDDDIFARLIRDGVISNVFPFVNFANGDPVAIGPDVMCDEDGFGGGAVALDRPRRGHRAKRLVGVHLEAGERLGQRCSGQGLPPHLERRRGDVLREHRDLERRRAHQRTDEK